MAAPFRDHFSGMAPRYAAHRPEGYPPALFDLLASLAPARGRAWDCGTGSGQAARPLAERFAEVIATDASSDQIAEAVARTPPDLRIDYRVAAAEASGLADASIDLVTVAQALHWFDFDRFYGEVRRVLRPGGVIAAWTYHLLRIEPAIDALVDRLYQVTVGAYWPPERRLVEASYRTIPFPFEAIEAPLFEFSADWDLERVIGYLGTWSAVDRFRQAHGGDPIAELRPALAAAWGDPLRTRTIRWPLAVRIGRATGILD